MGLISTRSLLPEKPVLDYDFDTDHSIEVVDVEIKISKENSDRDPG